MNRPLTRPEWRWNELYFQTMTSPAAAATALEHLAAHRALGPVVLKLRATANGLRWLVATNPGATSAMKELLKAHLDVRVTTPRRVRRAVTTAGALHFGGSLSTAPERVVATLRGLYGALSRLEAKEEIALQLLIGGRLSPSGRERESNPSWAGLLLQAATGRTGGSSALRTPPSAREADLHGARIELRIGVSGVTPARAQFLGNQVLGALRVLETAGTRTTLTRENPAKLNQSRPPWRWPMRLRSSELVALSGWPVGEPPMPVLGSLHPRMLPPGRALVKTERVIGKVAAPGNDDPVGIPVRDAVMHTHLFGPTNSGKSTVLLNLILADIIAGRGVLVIDPKGDLATDVLARVPEKRHDDVVVIDPSSSCPVGMNPLAGPEHLAPVVADTLLATFESVFRDNWGIRSADVLSASLLTLARIPEANLLWLSPLLTNPAFRRWMLKRSHDPLGVDSFWRQYEAKKPDAQAVEIAPVLNKLRQIILRPGLRAVLGQTEPKFDLDELFTRRRIIIVSLNKGVLGADAARLLGSLLVGQLWSRILARQQLPPERRHIVGIYIDEVHDFIHGIPGDLSDALAQARSLGAAFTLTNQYLSQLSPDMQQAIDANARNKIVFGLGGVDATTMSRKADGLDAADFQLLPKYHAYADLLQGGHRTGWFALKAGGPPPERQPAAELYASSHARYGVPAEQTERELIALLHSYDTPSASSLESDEPVGRIRTRRAASGDEGAS
ncbi:hypothetical protein Csp1_19990 [Corynebacterium provencense]|uniref:Type IV secretion system coupling protein TraD DNA-binding domain-containing protein n=1 Tax=Corynebacterium provencense TaxID=1737425 RepID=A0A2Z3YXF9_9CORY|nr:hypothetical protein [Corynebacterium provencense]AWT26767.1 hypothetical protein Csp1_19990 [Corynebacterium provencense]